MPEALFTRTKRAELLDKMKRREFWIVGPEYSDAEKEFRVVYNELKRLQVPFDRPGTYNNPEGGQMSISLWEGTFQVHAKSAKYPDSLVGEGLSGVIMAEAAKMKPTVWTKYIRPTLADFNGWSLHSSTPEGKNHFYEKWQMGQNPAIADWASWRMPSWVNPYVYKEPTRNVDVKKLQQLIKQVSATTDLSSLGNDDEANAENLGLLRQLCNANGLIVDSEILDMMNDLTEEAFNQEIGAEFTEFVGRVFKDFDEEVHVANLPYNPRWQTFGACDYGFTNPNVWLLIQVGPFGEINVIDEIYEAGLTADEFAEKIRDRGLAPGSMKKFYPDPASPGDSRILERILKVPAGGGTGGELRHRLDAIRAALREFPTSVPRGHVDRRPKMMVDPKCKMLIHELQEMRYPEKKEQNSTLSQELPMKKDDHAPEALGRFFQGLFGTPQDLAKPARISKARFNR